MDLQEFVNSSLQQIAAGVAAAQATDGRIAPAIRGGEDDPKILRTFHNSEGVFLVEFDVAVTVSEASEKGVGGGITVLSVAAAKGDVKRSLANSSVSRVKFSVPITYHEPPKT
jgi:hypothetical protein